MTFNHRYPTATDYDTMPIIEWTSPKKWEPQSHLDDHVFTNMAFKAPTNVEDNATDKFYECKQGDDGGHWSIGYTLERQLKV